MQQVQKLELPAHVKKAIEAINTQIEYLNLIVNAPPPIDAKIELQYNKDEFIKVPDSILFHNLIDVINNEIFLKKSHVKILEKTFILFNENQNVYVQDYNIIPFTNDFTVLHTRNIEAAYKFDLDDIKAMSFLNDYIVLNIYNLLPIPKQILNTINID